MFDLEDAKKRGCLYGTTPARVICTDRADSQLPIVALYKDGSGCEGAVFCRADGRTYSGAPGLVNLPRASEGVIRAILHKYFALDGYENVERSYPHLVEEAEKQIRRILSHAEGAGFVLVPKEPTEEMQHAGYYDSNNSIESVGHLAPPAEEQPRLIYRAMLEKAPKP